jgi:hypothetical protein
VTSADDLIPLSGGGRSVVYRRGDVVIRDAAPWTPAVHALLRHLEDAGFAAAPRLVGSGLDTDGREVLTFIDGEFTQPGPWSLDGAAAVGRMLRDLHRATRSFRPPPDAEWFPWHGRDLGDAVKVFGHCDVAPGTSSPGTACRSPLSTGRPPSPGEHRDRVRALVLCSSLDS